MAEGSRNRNERRSKRLLADVLVFVKHIRADRGLPGVRRETLHYLAEEKKTHPEFAGSIAEMERLAGAIESAVEKRRTSIRKPEYVAALTQRFRDTLLDYQGSDALARCREITEAIVEVGGNQDELVGECRLAVKILRQRAGLAMATDPRAAEIAKELRSRTQAILRNATMYEAPRQ